ncbi:pre-peptidase C-terminal domain-containing protein [Leptolyngbya sp. 7M]|uniref:pre-peptidase C-terminal domain-containing protein n=1 Tax=Leptolyngbya sp. 7M TaxID=2812896 RepID=UPI001B8A9591|nr:pre-peptidase C-terminal domain-containing protein [Leptolyngbya sp. 7M]QYO63352.1 pre-peptidase C-terminal domain-containing protein [Leptolyngbya sp. 7M]
MASLHRGHTPLPDPAPKPVTDVQQTAAIRSQATGQSGEPAQSGTIHSVWWKWTAPNSGGTLTLDTFGSNFNTFLSVFSGTSVSSLTPLARNDDTDGWPQSQVQLTVQPNQTYYIAVDGHNTATGQIKLNYRFGQPPANDRFATATTLTGTSGSISGNNTHALGEPGEPAQSGTLNSLWWKWTAPRNGVLTVDTLNSQVDAYLSLFSSTSSTPSFATLTTLAQDDYSAGWSQGRVQVEVQSGKTYYIAVDGYVYLTGAIKLNYSFAESPKNDRFANADLLEGTANQVTGTNINALGESGEPAQDGVINSVWWKWTAPRSGVFTVDTFASDFSTYVSVYSGTSNASLNTLTWLPRNGEGWGMEPYRWQAEVQAGTTYYIAVDGAGDLTGNIILKYNLADPPANDKFSRATALTERSGRVVGSNVNALSEAGEPEQSWTAHSVWWKWTAPKDGVLSVDTIGSQFDTYLSLFSGSSLNSLSVLAQNDNISGTNRQSRIQAPVRAGTTYYIAVDGAVHETGAITLNYQLFAPPANDHFANAKLLPGTSGQDSGSTIDASAEPGEPIQDGVIHSVWWKWTAPSNGVFTVETSDDRSIGTYLSLFRGSSLSNLVRLAQDGGNIAGVKLSSRIG